MKSFASLKKQTKILIFVTLAVVLLWGYYNTFYMVQLKDVRALQKDVANLEAIIKTMKDAGVTTVDSSADKFRLKLKEKDFAGIKESLNRVEKKLLERGNLSDCLSKLTSLCSQCRIEVGFFAPHPDKEADSGTVYKGLPLEINIHAAWPDLIGFLEELEKLPALAILKDIELTIDKERIPSVNGKLILELWLKD